MKKEAKPEGANKAIEPEDRDRGCRDSLLYEQWATTRDLSWMRLMKSRRWVMVMRSKLRRTKATM